jgi:probable HAF family extracellular repeat protein
VANAINGNGVIVGTASSGNGRTFGFELTPVS